MHSGSGEMVCSELFSRPVEIVTGQRAAHGGGVGVKQHLQVSRSICLQLVAGQADDVAVGQGLFGNGSLGHHALLFAQGSGAVQVGVGSFHALA